MNYKNTMGSYNYSNKMSKNKRMSHDSYSTRTGGSTVHFSVLPDECPLNRSNLGQIGWAVLHSFCAYYPDHPTAEDMFAMAQFIFLFGRFFPCRVCGENLMENLKKNPPEVGSNYSLNRWICNIHNMVNFKLGKPKYDCARACERWRYGWNDGSCLQPARH